jgi:hypothetical protein
MLQGTVADFLACVRGKIDATGRRRSSREVCVSRGAPAACCCHPTRRGSGDGRAIDASSMSARS